MNGARGVGLSREPKNRVHKVIGIEINNMSAAFDMSSKRRDQPCLFCNASCNDTICRQCGFNDCFVCLSRPWVAKLTPKIDRPYCTGVAVGALQRRFLSRRLRRLWVSAGPEAALTACGAHPCLAVVRDWLTADAKVRAQVQSAATGNVNADPDAVVVVDDGDLGVASSASASSASSASHPPAAPVPAPAPADVVVIVEMTREFAWMRIDEYKK